MSLLLLSEKKTRIFKFANVPNFLLSNVMSLTPKIGWVRDVVRRGNFQFVSFVETWLQSHIPDTVIDIQGYNLIRRDRKNGQHGGVGIYIKDLINYERINDLNNDHFEALWINFACSDY